MEKDVISFFFLINFFIYRIIFSFYLLSFVFIIHIEYKQIKQIMALCTTKLLMCAPSIVNNDNPCVQV